MKKTTRNLTTYNDGESKSFLQYYFGVDRWCTIYDEDEGFRLLADLSLCMYFGCGKKRVTEDESEVPIVVSVTTSEDYDCNDTVSDMWEDHNCRSGKLSAAKEGTTTGSRKPDPPSQRPDAKISSSGHPPLPLSTMKKQKNEDESSRVAAHYESRKPLAMGVVQRNTPPATVIVRAKPGTTNRPPRKNRGILVYHKRSSEINQRYQADEYPEDEDPLIDDSDSNSSVFGYT